LHPVEATEDGMEREIVGVFHTYALGMDESAAHGKEDRQVHS